MTAAAMRRPLTLSLSFVKCEVFPIGTVLRWTKCNLFGSGASG